MLSVGISCIFRSINVESAIRALFPRNKVFLWGAGRKSVPAGGAQVAQPAEILARGRKTKRIHQRCNLHFNPACFVLLCHSLFGPRAARTFPLLQHLRVRAPNSHPRTHHTDSTRFRRDAIGPFFTDMSCVSTRGDIFHPLYFRVFFSLDGLEIWRVRSQFLLNAQLLDSVAHEWRTAEASGFAKRTRDIIHTLRVHF